MYIHRSLTLTLLYRCHQSDAYIASYIQGQSATTGRPDGYICDSNVPSSIVSEDPRLTLRYTTHNIPSDASYGFLANYLFTIGKLMINY